MDGCGGWGARRSRGIRTRWASGQEDACNHRSHRNAFRDRRKLPEDGDAEQQCRHRYQGDERRGGRGTEQRHGAVEGHERHAAHEDALVEGLKRDLGPRGQRQPAEAAQQIHRNEDESADHTQISAADWTAERLLRRKSTV